MSPVLLVKTEGKNIDSPQSPPILTDPLDLSHPLNRRDQLNLDSIDVSLFVYDLVEFDKYNKIQISILNNLILRPGALFN